VISGDARPVGVTHPARQTDDNNININNVVNNDVIIFEILNECVFFNVCVC